MPSIRERIIQFIGGDILTQNRREVADVMTEAYRYGPAMMRPDQLIEWLQEFDSELADMLARRFVTYDTAIGLDSGENQRMRLVIDARVMYETDVLSQHTIDLWTDFGFGLRVDVTPRDELAAEVWDEFWNSPRNQIIVNEREIQGLSTDVLTDGEVFFVIFASKLDGTCTIRTIPSDQIKERITDPEDEKTTLYWKRESTPKAGAVSVVTYYPDWRASAEELAKAKLPDDAVRAELQNDQTDVVILPAQHLKRRGRGRPLLSTSAPYARAYKQFLEHRAEIQAAAAAYLDKVKVKGGQRAVDMIRARLESSLAAPNSSRIETNPPPAAGSTWIEGDGTVERSRLQMGTGAGDAETDGGAIFRMAVLGGRIFPHWAGSGESFRLATACYADDTEILTRDGWKNHLEWDGREAVACYDPQSKETQFLVPETMLVYDYRGSMTAITGRASDLLVTPNHRMLILNENNMSKEWAKKDWEVVRADEMPSRFSLPAGAPDCGGEFVETFTLPGYTSLPNGNGGTRKFESKEFLMNDWLEFLGWWIAEGWLEKTRNKPHYGIGFCVSANAPELDSIRSLIKRLPFKFSEGLKTGENVLRWRCTSKALYTWLEEHCGNGAANKKVPAFIFDLAFEQRKLFLDTLWLGDGHSEHLKHYRGFLTTISKQLADDTQRLILSVGEWGSLALSYAAGEKIGKNVKTNRDCYIVHRNERFKISMERNRNVETVDYQGKVVCFKVKTGFYITRRNGHLAIAGNTAMERPTLLAFNRYQNFWSSVWTDIAKIVFAFAELYGGKQFENTEVDVNTDSLLAADPELVLKTLDSTTALVANTMLDADVGTEIVDQLMRILLQGFGVRDVDEVMTPPEFEPEAVERRIAKAAAFVESGETSYVAGLRSYAYGLWSGQLDHFQFVDGMFNLISRRLTQAWQEGALKVGVKPDELTDIEMATLQDMINNELEFVTRLAEWIEEHSKANDGLFRTVQQRIDMWDNRYKDTRSRAMSMAETDPKLKWVGVGRCSSCKKLVGKIKRASQWEAMNLRPGTPPNPMLECGGWKCGCSFEPTIEPLSRGRMPRLMEDENGHHHDDHTHHEHKGVQPA